MRDQIRGESSSQWGHPVWIPNDASHVHRLTRQDGTTGELFAQVSYVKPFSQVEPVLDSSRYFVLRVEGEGGKVAYIGMGFQERGDAFDFQVSAHVSTFPCFRA